MSPPPDRAAAHQAVALAACIGLAALDFFTRSIASSPTAATLAATWRSGLTPGPRVVLSEPANPLVHAWTFPPGLHTGASAQNFDVGGVLHFFGKTELLVLPASR